MLVPIMLGLAAVRGCLGLYRYCHQEPIRDQHCCASGLSDWSALDGTLPVLIITACTITQAVLFSTHTPLAP